MYDKSQLMRGTLEGCILKILSQNTKNSVTPIIFPIKKAT